MQFSVCTPVTFDRDDPDNFRMPRYEMFLRCANSMNAQIFTDFEWVVADDMSNPPVESLVGNLIKVPNIKVMRLPEKLGRISGRNVAMKASEGDWICWLDADDEYASWYLQCMSEAIKLYPEYKMFNFNHLVFNYDYTLYPRKFIDMDAQRDLPFRAGVVGAGSWIFHRSIYEKVGLIPELGLWDFAYKAFEEFPEIKPFYWNGAKQNYDTLGNPFGEDFYYFYKMTREFKCKYLDIYPYFVHSRWGHCLPGSPDFVKDPGAKPSFDSNNK